MSNPKSKFIQMAIKQGLGPKEGSNTDVTHEQHQYAQNIFYPEGVVPLNPAATPIVSTVEPENPIDLLPKDYSAIKINERTSQLITKHFGQQSRKLLYSRAIRSDTTLTVVRVFTDGIEEEKIDMIFDERGLQEIRTRSKKRVWELPIYPIAFVDIYNVSVPSKKQKRSARKVHWRGKSPTDNDWGDAVFGTDFNKYDIGTHSEWFPINSPAFSKSLYPNFMAMIIESADKRFLTPEQINEGVDIDELQNECNMLPITHKFNKTGWACANSWEEKDIQAWEHINPDHELYSGSSERGYMVTSGDARIQKDAIAKQIEKYPVLGVYFAMAAGGFARGMYNSKGQQFKGEISTLVNLNGKGGKSKSSTMSQIQSIFTTPRNSKQFISKATPSALELIAECANHGVFFLDELQVACDSNNGAEIMTALMSLLNGVGKQATRNVGSEQREPRTYDNLIFGSANSKIIEMITRRLMKGYDAFSDALMSRVIELDIDVWAAYPCYDASTAEYREVQNDIENLNTILRANHGFLYPELIAYYIENRDELYDKMTTVAGNLSEFYNIHEMTGDATRKKHFFAYTEAGMEAFFEIMMLPEDVKQKVRAKWLEMVQYIVDCGLNNRVKKEEDIFAKVNGWIQSNYGKFAVYGTGGNAGYAWIPGKDVCDEKTQKMYAQSKISACSDVNSKCYGGFFQKTLLTAENAWTGVVGLNHMAVEAIQKDLGIDFEVFLSEAKDANLLECDKGGRLTKKIRMSGGLSSFYCFKIGDYLAQNPVENDDETLDNVEPTEEISHHATPVEFGQLDDDWGKIMEDASETGLTKDNIREELFFNSNLMNSLK